MKRKSSIFNFQFLILALLLVMPGCKSKQSASESRTRMTGSTQLSILNQSIKADTATAYSVTQSNGYIFIKETQTITEYDTNKPNNPVSKKTETEKNTFQGTQTGSRQKQSEGKRSESSTFQNKAHESELITQNSEKSSSTPVVHTTVKWHVVGSIVIAVITLITTWLARRHLPKKPPP